MTRRTLSLALLVSALGAALVPGGTAAAQGSGVVLYEGTRLSGERIGLARDTFDLNETAFGTRRASSVDVASGCRATLFEFSGYRGASVEVTSRIDDLAATRLGRRAVASVRVTCSGSGSGWGSGPGSVGSRGVTLFRDAKFEGESETFAADVPDLSRTRIGARQASSVEVPDGCVATLFAGPGFSGRSTTFRQAHDNLRLTDVGNDTASSLRVDCPVSSGSALGGGWGSGAYGRGVTLFRDAGFKGASETFDVDVPDLSPTRVGARQASSIDVPEGCVATLFTGVNFSGRSAEFREAHDNLRLTDVGNDAAASLRVDCGRRPRNLRPGGPQAPASGPSGVTLYRDKDFGGESESFRSDVPDLSRTRVGGRQASSIEVPPGCRVTLFTETGYRGRSATFDGDHGNLRETPVGNDAALSMRVVCGSHGW